MYLSRLRRTGMRSAHRSAETDLGPHSPHYPTPRDAPDSRGTLNSAGQIMSLPCHLVERRRERPFPPGGGPASPAKYRSFPAGTDRLFPSAATRVDAPGVRVETGPLKRPDRGRARCTNCGGDRFIPLTFDPPAIVNSRTRASEVSELAAGWKCVTCGEILGGGRRSVRQ
jgi:hypothetical protein